MEKKFIVYRPDERPDVQVLVDEVWCPGELRMWSRTDAGWTADVQYRPPGQHSSYISSFAEDVVRPDLTDYSAGRT